MTNPAEAGDTGELAAMLKALGEPTRLRIFQFLRSCCGPVAVDEETGDVRPVQNSLSGPTVGEVCCHVTGQERVTSTISEHLKDLRIAGVILMERRGKNVVCAVNPVALSQLAAFFVVEESQGITQSDSKGMTKNECCNASPC